MCSLKKWRKRQKKTGENLRDLELAKDDLNGTQKTNYRTKHEKLDLITIITVCFTKDT